MRSHHQCKAASVERNLSEDSASSTLLAIYGINMCNQRKRAATESALNSNFLWIMSFLKYIYIPKSGIASRDHFIGKSFWVRRIQKEIMCLVYFHVHKHGVFLLFCFLYLLYENNTTELMLSRQVHNISCLIDEFIF